MQPANPPEQGCFFTFGTAAHQPGFYGAGKASEANATSSAVSPDLSENARSHRSVDTDGDQGSSFTLGSEQRRQDSLPGCTLSARRPPIRGDRVKDRTVSAGSRSCRLDKQVE